MKTNLKILGWFCFTVFVVSFLPGIPEFIIRQSVRTGTPAYWWLGLAYLYFVVTTECDIYAILYVRQSECWKNWRQTKKEKVIKKKGRLKKLWEVRHYQMVRFLRRWGNFGMFISAATPFLGKIASAIFIASYLKISETQKITGRIALYSGYILRLPTVYYGWELWDLVVKTFTAWIK